MDNALEARSELPAAAAEAVPASVLHTYPDGSQVVGVPPFPEMSPLEAKAKELRDESAGLIQNQQANAVALAAEAEAKAKREAEAAKVIAAAEASAQPAGIVTADQLAQSPDPLPETPAAA